MLRKFIQLFLRNFSRSLCKNLCNTKFLNEIKSLQVLMFFFVKKLLKVSRKICMELQREASKSNYRKSWRNSLCVEEISDKDFNDAFLKKKCIAALLTLKRFEVLRWTTFGNNIRSNYSTDLILFVIPLTVSLSNLLQISFNSVKVIMNVHIYALDL